MERLNPAIWEFTNDQRSALIAVAAGAVTVIVISLAFKRMRKLLSFGMLGLFVTAAWWWASAHGVIDQVHLIINGR